MGHVIHRYALDEVAKLLALAAGNSWTALSLEEQDVYRDMAFAVDDFYSDLTEAPCSNCGSGGLVIERAAA